MSTTPFDPYKLEFDTDFVDEDESGDSGDEGSGSDSSGTGSFSSDEGVLWWLDTHLKQEIREGESKFGKSVPFTEDPLKRQKSSLESGGERLQGHPLFADTQRFDGIFEDINNPSPPNNPEASDNYQHRLANMPKPTSTPRYERR
jgi:hypothetical protein